MRHRCPDHVGAAALVTATRAAALVLALPLLATTAQAQQVFKSVGADGVITYSDGAGAGYAAQATALTAGETRADSTGNPPLPYALQQAAQRYPVTLYTTASCDACGLARAFLITRGVPYVEKTVTTTADAAALKAFANTTDLPALRVGTLPLTGFAADTWADTLDAAGYPSASQLPTGWHPRKARPLGAASPAGDGTDSAAAEGDRPADAD